MSDFNNLCDAFDVMGLKYTVREEPSTREVVIDGSKPNVDYIGLRKNAIWFEFDGNSGNFNMLYAEE